MVVDVAALRSGMVSVARSELAGPCTAMLWPVRVGPEYAQLSATEDLVKTVASRSVG